MRLLPQDKELGWTPYVWLVYLGFFFIQPSVDWDQLEGVAGDCAGLRRFPGPLFHGVLVQGAPAVLWVIAAITLLGIGFAPFNAGAAVFFNLRSCVRGLHRRHLVCI